MPQNKIRTEDIVDSQITYAKIQNVSNNNLLLGRNTAGAGLIEELNAATAKAILALNNVENVALSTWTGSTNINTLGTITQGTWSGSTISIDKGGTGLNTLGTANQVLAVNSGGTALQYVTPLSGTGTAGQVTFWTGTNSQGGDNGLFWDNTNKRLGVGTNAPAHRLQILGPSARFENSSGTFEFDIVGGGTTSRIQTTATGMALGTLSNNALIFWMNASERMRINSSTGHVGINQTAPAARLHVVGSSTGTTAWTAQFHNSGGTSNSLMIRDDGNIGINTNTPNARLQVHGADTADTGWTAKFHNSLGNSNSLMIRNDGNVGIGTNAPAAKLEVDPIVNQTGILVAGYSLTGSSTIPAIDITGAWNTSGIATLIRGNLTNNVSAATSRLIDLQVSGTSQFRVLPNGTINGSELIGQLSGTIAVRSNLTNVAGNYVTIDNNSSNITTTTGIVSGVIIRSSYIPPSGTGVFVGLNLNHTINQSSGSGSTGITRGLLVNPALTSAFDWRSIEWTNNTGWGLYGSGTANNYLAGNLSVGTSGTTARLVVRGSGATSGSTAMLVENSGGTSMLMVREDGNVGIGTNAPTTRLDVSGTARVQGTTTITPAANTSAITSTGYSVTGSDTTRMIDLSGTWNTTGNVTAINLDITNTASGVNSNLINCSINGTTNIFSVRRTGEVAVQNLYSFHSSNGTLSATSTLTIQTAASQTGGIFLNKSASVTATSGDFPTITLNNISNSFAPTSGTATFTSIRAIPTINQTGGANGITRGIIVSPTLTSAFDWRSIEWTNSSGWGLYGEGTANNYLGGNLSVGTTGSTARLVVVGSQPSGTTTWTAQFHNALGNSNSLMIRDDGNVGIGTSTPTSRLDVVGTVEFQNPSAAFDTPSFGSELLTTGAGTNWTGTSFASGYTHTTGSTAALTSAFTPLNGHIYRVVVTTTNLIFGQSVTVTFGGVLDQTITSNTTITFDSRTINTSALVITPSNNFTGTVTASVKVISPTSPLFVVRASTNNTIYQQIFNTNGTNLIQGTDAGKYTTTGSDNLFQGSNSGIYNTGGSFNVFQGGDSGFFNTNGNNNVFQGYRAGFTNRTGGENLFQGAGAGYSNTIGNANTFVGRSAGYSNTTGNWNVFQGAYSGFYNTNGSLNVSIGYLAGYYITAGTINTKLDNSILIGHDTRVPATGQTNQIVIGDQARGLGSNTTVIGNTGTTISLIHGNVSAGETNPKNKLETSGSFGRGSLVQVSTSSYTVGDNDTWIRVSTATGSVTLTLPDPTAWIRREIMIIRTSGATVISASSNVVKFAGAGTAILGGDDLRCTLVSDGTNWYFM